MTRHAESEPTTGLLLLSADRARIAEWHPRRVEEIESLDLVPTEAAEHELVGPSYSHPRGSGERATSARASAQRDLWERRMDEHRARFVRSVASRAARAARAQGWDLVLVLGDPRRAVPACEELVRHGVATTRSDLKLDWLRPAALAERLAPEVEQARAELAPGGTSRR